MSHMSNAIIKLYAKKSVGVEKDAVMYRLKRKVTCV
jgi:hypothetical protein